MKKKLILTCSAILLIATCSGCQTKEAENVSKLQAITGCTNQQAQVIFDVLDGKTETKKYKTIKSVKLDKKQSNKDKKKIIIKLNNTKYYLEIDKCYLQSIHKDKQDGTTLYEIGKIEEKGNDNEK